MHGKSHPQHFAKHCLKHCSSYLVSSVLPVNKRRQRVGHVLTNWFEKQLSLVIDSSLTPLLVRSAEMPPRRSSRTPSARTASKPPSDSKVESESQINGVNVHESSSKRRPSERPQSPPAKRLRSDSKKSENQPPTSGTRKPPSRTATTKKASDVAKKTRKLSPVGEAEPIRVAKPEQKQVKPYFNQLPTPPEKQRPSLLPFVWGAGNFGQFGLGPDVLGELSKPKRHNWMETKIMEGTFGEPGAGIESVAGGGLHSVFIDEKGTVCQNFPCCLGFSHQPLGLDMWHE